MQEDDRILYPMPYFDGGLHTKSSSHVIGDNESGDTLNCDTDNTGSIRTRNGTTAITHNTLATGIWYGLDSYQPKTGNSQVVAWYNSSMMYLSNITWVTIPSADGVFNNTTNVVHAVYDNYLFCGDGGQPYKWNGTEFTRHGIEVPSAALVSTAATAGANTGIYMYKINWVNSQLVEGDLGSAVTISLGATSSIVSMTGIPTAVISYGVNRRNIYRTKTGGSVFYYLATLSDNTTTTYKDEILDTALITVAPTDQGKPPNYTLLKTHKDRLFSVDQTDPSIVKYSEIGNPYVFKVLNTEPIGKGDGRIRSLGTQSDSLVCVKNTNEVWLLYLSDNNPANWFPIKTNTQYGSGSAFNVNIEDEFVYLACTKENPIGFAGLSGVNPINEVISTDIGQTTADLISDRVEPEIFLFNKNALEKVQGIVFKNKLYLSYASGSSTTPNKMFLYDFRRRTIKDEIGAWLPWDGIQPYFFTVSDNKLIAATLSGGLGKLIQFEVPNIYSDSGVAINSYFETKFFGGRKADQTNHKDFRWLYLWVSLLGNWKMNLYKKTDFDIGSGDVTELSLASASSLWGSFLWGNNWSDAASEKEFVVDLGKLNGRRIKYRFSNQNKAGQAFKVNRGNFEYILRTRRRNSV